MNEAARSQAESAQRSVTEAYRGQLRLLRDRIDSYWDARASALQQNSGAGKPGDFRRMVMQGAADSFVFLKSDGSIAYPIPTPPFDPNPAPSPARTAQSQIRGMVQRGDKEGAIEAIARNFSPRSAAEAQTIAADEQLLLLHLTKPRDPRFQAALRRVNAWLNDYSEAMPSAHRLFLMDGVREIAPKTEFPTYGAERLAAQFVEAGGGYSLDSALQRTRLPDVWQLAAPKARVIALLRTDTVLAAMRTLLEPSNSSTVRFAVLAPDAPTSGEAIAAGARLPGWQVAYSLLDATALESAGRRRVGTYLWIGYLAIAAIALTGLIAGQYFRRQLRLTRLKTGLVAAVSHELKTPLASMRLLVDALLDEESPDPRKTREYLELIEGENLRLTRLVENFLTFSRIERNRQRLEFAPTDPSRVVQGATQAVRERFQAPGCQLEIGIDPDLPQLYADESALVTVLLNLLDNAYKYTPADKRIAVRARREPGGVTFAVEDNGIGIAPGEQKRIFREFYQVDQRLARETGGCGLGLSIVDHLVRAHGGSVRVESRAGQGSRFLVSLPCQAGS